MAMKLLKSHKYESSEQCIGKVRDGTSVKAKSRWKMVKDQVLSLGREKLLNGLRSGDNSDGSIDGQKVLRLGFILVEEAFGTKLKGMVMASPSSKKLCFIHFNDTLLIPN